MKKLCTAILCLLLMVSTSYAVCTGSSPTWTAASASHTDINACIAAATSGDTINVPAGTVTYGNEEYVTIPEEKTIILIGAGIASTILTKSADNCFIKFYSPSTRISGFRFNRTDTSSPMIEGANAGFRIDHNYFDNQGDHSVEGVSISGANTTAAVEPEGLIDSNTFSECRIVATGTTAFARSNAFWNTAHTFGDVHSVYVENNTITRASGTAIDITQSGKMVFRYNNVTMTGGTNALMCHGLDSPAGRGTRAWEIYNNAITQSALPIAQMRGGTGMIFNNVVTGVSGTAYIDLDDVRSFEGGCANACLSSPTPLATDSKICDGNSSWDKNTADLHGYICRDQIGTGADVTLFNTSDYGAAPVSEPAYFWNNKKSTGENIAPSVSAAGYCATHILLNRDFFTCTDSSCAKSGYSIYTCPHPLADPGATGYCNPAIAGTTGYNLEAGGDPVPHAVTPSIDRTDCTVSPSISTAVEDSATLELTFTCGTDFFVTVGGTCGGSLSGATYTTSAVVADCTVVGTCHGKKSPICQSNCVGGATIGAGGTTTF